jgi:hypothetical protein
MIGAPIGTNEYVDPNLMGPNTTSGLLERKA